MHDIIIIGAGVVGCCIAEQLAHYNLNITVLEAKNDIATGASCANSGIIHAGYDCKVGTLKAKHNFIGNKLIYNIAETLSVPHRKTGSIVVATKEQLNELQSLKERGDKNGVQTVILSRDEILKIEPNISNDIEYALYAPSAGIISPYKLTIALGNSAKLNGVDFRLNHCVKSIFYNGQYYTITTTNNETFDAKLIVNCAGAGACEINEIAGIEKYTQYFQVGEYFVLDNTESNSVNTVIFPLPTEMGKGILVAPTADGNIIYGPTSRKIDEYSTAVSKEGLDDIKIGVSKVISHPNFSKTIRVYAGVRTASGDDFIIERSKLLPNFIYLIGICSPGLTSAPSISVQVTLMVEQCLGVLSRKENFISLAKPIKTKNMDKELLNDLIKKDSRFGKIVCRCELVTEGEIINAINSPIKATTLDAIKRRVRTGMGRCQGGFCTPKIMEILSKELKVPMTQIKKSGDDSEIAPFNIGE